MVDVADLGHHAVDVQLLHQHPAEGAHAAVMQEDGRQLAHNLVLCLIDGEQEYELRQEDGGHLVQVDAVQVGVQVCEDEEEDEGDEEEQQRRGEGGEGDELERKNFLTLTTKTHVKRYLQFKQV